MVIGSIAGLAATPVGILLLFNVFHITQVEKIFGIPLLFISAVVLIILQITNILDSHIDGNNSFISYSVHIVSAFPSWIYFLSFIIALPAHVTAALPAIFGALIFLEGLWSLFLFV